VTDKDPNCGDAGIVVSLQQFARMAAGEDLAAERVRVTPVESERRRRRRELQQLAQQMHDRLHIRPGSAGPPDYRADAVIFGSPTRLGPSSPRDGGSAGLSGGVRPTPVRDRNEGASSGWSD
jgi:hypothetical protein